MSEGEAQGLGVAASSGGRSGGPTDPSPQAVSAVPAPAANAELTPNEVRVLCEMRRDWGFPFAELAANAELPVAEVRAIVRSFHMRGLADFGPLYDDDDGSLRGRGYWLSREGRNAQNLARIAALSRLTPSKE